MDEAQESAAPARASIWWPAIGCAIGLAVAAYGMLERAPNAGALPEDAVARVNERLIGVDHYRRTVERLETAAGRELAPEDRARVLTQMVEEELLVQRGLELGLTASEATVRAALVQSLVASVTAEADAADPGDAELARFLADNAADYTYASASRVAAWIADDEWLAQDFAARLREALEVGDEPPEGVRAVPGLPTTAAPPERLRMFLGPAITAAATEMPPQSVAVYARQGRWYIVFVQEHETETRAELAAIRSQVLLDYRQALAERALRDYVDGLRESADIVVIAP